jgi:hypothetical protein
MGKTQLPKPAYQKVIIRKIFKKLNFSIFSKKSYSSENSNNRNRLNSTRAFKWCINNQVSMKKYFGPFFT